MRVIVKGLKFQTEALPAECGGRIGKGDKMFFKRTRRSSDISETKQRAMGWDEKTIEYIANSDRFSVKITNVCKLNRFGTTRENEPVPIPKPYKYEISGVVTFPKLILVSISFQDDLSESESIGGWAYNFVNGNRFLELYLSDLDGKVASALFEAHNVALLSGRRHSDVRFWKRKGDGVMTEQDREHGISYERRYPLIGLYTWAELKSASLPEWAVPYDSERFSIKNLPESYDLRL